MEHSLYTYLERLPLLKLENLLQELRSGINGENYAYVIPMIEEIMEKRKNQEENNGIS